MSLPVTLGAPAACAAAGVLALLAAAAGRRAMLPAAAKGLALVALSLLSLAAGEPIWRTTRPARVAVFADESPSTRGAAWRTPRDLAALAETWGKITPFGADADETKLTIPPDAEAALVLTDGRLAIDNPAAVPLTFAFDPALDAAADARVTRLELDGDAVSVAAAGGGTLTVAGRATPVGESASLRLPPDPNRATTAAVASRDAWPENDALTLPPAALAGGRRLWVGGVAPSGFEQSGVAADAATWADAAVVVLNNVPADALDARRRRALTAYVADFGGSLLVLGGGRAFGAGGYGGTPLDDLSPLASRPPTPRADWVLLVDQSGSMAASTGDGRRRFDAAADALLDALPTLPPTARVDVAGFADALEVWASGLTPASAARAALPPAAARPGGGTNLAAALRQLAARASPDRPTQIVALTDADADLGDDSALADTLKSARVTLNVIAVGGGDAAAVRRLAAATGGQFVAETDAAKWSDAAEQLAAAASAVPLMREAKTVMFTDDWGDLPPLRVDCWNPTWPKTEASRLTNDAPHAAVWQVGLGRVAAAAFAAPPSLAATMADRIESAPAPPGVTVTWNDSAALSATIAFAAALPDGPVVLRRDGRLVAAVRVAPRRWRATLGGDRRPAVAVIEVGGRAVDRRATAGRYAPEFEAVGNDRPAAGRRGAAAIDLGGPSRWEVPRVARVRRLTTPLALLAAAALGIALWLWRRSSR